MTTEVKLNKLTLKNPVILASGTFDRNITKHIDVNKLGAVVTKTVTINPMEGNPLPHVIKTKYGFLNSVGLKNPGVKKYLSEELPFWQKYSTIIIPSIGGHNLEEYIELTEIFNRTDIQALEVNVSCPNVDQGGLAFGREEKILKNLVKQVRKVFAKTLIVKLSPNVTDITQIAKAAIDGGANVLTISNTFLGLEIDNKKHVAKLARKVGGYSGPAIKPMALRSVHEVYNNLKCPNCSIIGGGGIDNFDDALDFIMCGASAIFIGSASYADPKISEKIAVEFDKYINDNKIINLEEIRGII